MKIRFCDIFYLLEYEFHAKSEFLFRVDLQLGVELFNQNVELLRTKLVQNASSLTQQNVVRRL